MTAGSRSTVPLAAGTSDQRAQDGTSHGAHRPCGRALTVPSSESLHFLQSEWSAEDWAALKTQNSKQRRRSKREISHAAHLNRVEFLAAQWSADILLYYGWNKKSRDFILKLYQCAKKYPRYEDDFVPQANLVLWLKHCAAIAAIDAPATTDRSFAGSNGHFKVKDLDYLLELEERKSTEVYNVAVTSETARECQEDIREWTQSQDSRVHLHGKIIDLRESRADHWNIYLLKFDRTGLLTRRDELDSLNVKNGCEDQSPVQQAPHPYRGFLSDTGNNEKFIIRERRSTDAEAPTATRVNGKDRNALRPSDRSMGTPYTERAEAMPSSTRSLARPPNSPNQGNGDAIVLSDDEHLEEQAATHDAIDQTEIRGETLDAGGYDILYEEATMVEQLPPQVVQVAYMGRLSHELVPPTDNDHIQRVLSAAAKRCEEATERVDGTNSIPLATIGELPRTPISPQTEENMHEPPITTGTPSHAASFSNEMAKKHVVSDDTSDGNIGEQLRLGNIVSRLRLWKEECKRQQQEIEVERDALPDINALEDSAARAAERATELARLADEARQAADSARKASEGARCTANKIASAERAVEQLLQKSKQAREELGID